MSGQIGFMQGRLSPLVDGRIQAFPWGYWQDEFPLASSCGFGVMEWTLDQERLYENPLMNESGQEEIVELCAHNRLSIPSVTGDCFMQAPFWKAKGREQKLLKEDFIAVIHGCKRVGISCIVVPLVDYGRIENSDQEDILVEFLHDKMQLLKRVGIQIAFESDFAPKQLARFIEQLDSHTFGVNYDIGNSASLGYSSLEEFDEYGHRIINVHIKDRELGGSTVPLGEGSADFSLVFSLLGKFGYRGNYILQTARATSGNHAAVLQRYRKLTADWIKTNGA